MPDRALLSIVVALTCAAVPAPALAGGLHPDGRWLKDEDGRVVIVHGLEVAHKQPPYVPAAASFDDADGRNLSDWGFDAVRLAWFWDGLQHIRGQVDPGYVAELVREGRVLSDHGIYTLLEAHQDLYGAPVRGRGFPDWATLTDGVPLLPPSAGDIEAPATDRAFDNLYADTDGIADAFAHAWSVMAGAFRDNPRMLGYDLFNEPYAGSQFPACVVAAGCPAFDRLTLAPLEDKLAAGVRSADPRSIVFYEPHIYFDFGVASFLPPPPVASGPTAFAFHLYCLAPIFTGQPDHESQAPGYQSCPQEDEHVVDNGEAAAAAMRVPPLLDEFGDTQDLTNVGRQIALADSHLMGWMFWGYKDWVDAPGGAGSGALFDNSDDDSTLRTAKLEVVSRPYPQATAGTPASYSFDPDTDTMRYRFAPDHSIAAPTVVFVGRLHYPDGYRVTVTGGRVLSAPGATRLLIAPRHQARSVELVVAPWSGGSKEPRDIDGR
jgi:endoglycosylceramidase